MRLTLLSLGRYVPFRGTPGAVWGGKQRKIPELTNRRKAGYLDRLLVERQNLRYLANPYIDEEQEAPLLPLFRARELARDDQVYYNIYETKFRVRYPNRSAEEFAGHLSVERKFDV